MTNTLPRGLTGLIGLLTLIGLGCGSKGGAALTLGSFCDQKAANECGKTGSGGVADKCGVNADTCKAKRVTVCLAWAADIQANFPSTRPFSPDKAPKCLSQTTTVYTKATIIPLDRKVMDDLCQQVFSGSKKMGDTCANDFECDPDMTLACDTSLVTPVCAKKSTVAAGAFCSSPGATCPATQYCAIPTGMTQLTCVAKKAAGETCDDKTSPCVDALRCSATCLPKVDIGGACTVDSDCATAAPYCDIYPPGGSVCHIGFIPSPGTPECTAFGAA